jgi:hypothetical protein
MEGPAVIDSSGYRITRLVEFDMPGRPWLTAKKFPQACAIGGRASQ